MWKFFLLFVFFVIAGCNGSNSDSGSNQMKGTTIGLVLPLSEEKGKPRHHAALLAAQHLTEAGYSVHTLVEDSKLDRFLAVEAARKLVNNGVKVLVGASDSGITMEIVEWVSIPNQIPQISNASTSTEITDLNDSGLLFRTVASDKLQGAVLAYWAKEEMRYERVAVLYREGSYGENLRTEFINEYQNRGGSVVIEIPHVPAPTGDFAISQDAFEGEIDLLANSKPQAIIAISRSEESDIYIRQIFSRGEFEDVEFVFVDANRGVTIFDDASFSKNSLTGMCGTSGALPNTSSRTIFESAYIDSFGSIDSTYLHNTYDAVVIAGLAAAYAEASNNTKAVDPTHINHVANPFGNEVGAGVEEIRKALGYINNGEDINYQGASGNVDFDGFGDVVSLIEVWCYDENGNIEVTSVCDVVDVESTPKEVKCKN